MADEVLEVDEDGNFVIPSPSSKSSKQNINPEIIELSESEIEESISRLFAQDAFEQMNPKDYRIYSDNNFIIIYIKLDKNETPINALIEKSSNKFKLKTTLNQTLSVELPQSSDKIKCDYSKEHEFRASYFGELFTVKIPVVA